MKQHTNSIHPRRERRRTGISARQQRNLRKLANRTIRANLGGK